MLQERGDRGTKLKNNDNTKKEKFGKNPGSTDVFSSSVIMKSKLE